jgi:hypothetical protein
MSLTSDEEIAALKVEIGGYQEKLNDPSKLASHETVVMISQRMHDARAYLTELTKQKTVILQCPPAGKYRFPLMYNVKQKNELILSLCFLRRSYLINEMCFSSPQSGENRLKLI